MKNSLCLTAIALLLAVSSLSAATHYVSLGSTNPTPPYTTWATAATNIQQAVNAAAAGDVVVVTNGVYPNRELPSGVIVTNPLTLVSVNGPEVTVIHSGAPCVSLCDGATLTGFTLTNGARGVWCATTNAFVTNCVIAGNSAPQGGGAYGCTLYGCTLEGNSAFWSDPGLGGGGGAYASTLYNCTLSGNSAYCAWLCEGGGGGACASTLYNCTLSGNSSHGSYKSGGRGGGAYASTLYNCTLSGNSALDQQWYHLFRPGSGGGAQVSTLHNCILTENYGTLGAGVDTSILYNCTLTGNLGDGALSSTLYNCALAGNSGIGASGSTLRNCTLTGNTGGGAVGSTLYNCITYFNTAAGAENYDATSTLSYCCTTPLPTNGVGNLSLDPQLASANHLSGDSPCRGAGSANYATGTDIDGELWGSPPCIGCDEYRPGAVTGPLVVGWLADLRAVTPGYAVNFTASIDGRATDSVWSFGDGQVALNQPYLTHSWEQPGDYLVALWAFNESNPGGVVAFGVIRVAARPVVYVSAASTNPQKPYIAWDTAAVSIQQAVSVAGPGAEIVITNGVYQGGIGVGNPITLRSVNGPQLTIINGWGTNQCIALGRATLTGLTLTNGNSEIGGGVHWGVLTNCVIAGNVAAELGGGAYGGTLYNCTLTGNSAGRGGGAFESTLYNCTLSRNSAPGFGGGAGVCALYNCTLTSNSTRGDGGGAEQCQLYNCTLSGNSAGADGGGASYCELYNCTLTGNSAPDGYAGGAGSSGLYNCIVYFNTEPNYESHTVLNYSCTTPLPANGVGNISMPPLFIDYTHGNLRLQSNSPCINAGDNGYIISYNGNFQEWFTNQFDPDGNPRIVSGTVDIGAYEYQGTGSRISYAWLQQYGLPTDGSADLIDSDADGHNNWQEWVCGTCPTNTLSVLRMVSAAPSGTNVTVTWQSAAGKNYLLQRSASLAWPFTLIATNIVGQAGTTIYTDTSAPRVGPWFYRVGVASP